MQRTKPLTQQQKWDEFAAAAKIVLVDFDGTLCEFSYPDMGPPMPGARQFMYNLLERELLPVIYTCRMSPMLYTVEQRAAAADAIHAWCEENDIPYHAIDSGENGKRLCLANVDDHGVHASRNNWDIVLWHIDKLSASEQVKQAERGQPPCDGQSASTQD